MAFKKVSLPKGFTSIGGMGQSWKPEKKNAQLIGTMIGVKVVKVERKRGKQMVKEPVKVYTIKTTDGGENQVWESAGLRALSSVKKGQMVCITFIGKRVIKKGQQPMREYDVAVKK